VEWTFIVKYKGKLAMFTFFELANVTGVMKDVEPAAREAIQDRFESCGGSLERLAGKPARFERFAQALSLARRAR
jgi:hypothetical protein